MFETNVNELIAGAGFGRQRRLTPFTVCLSCTRTGVLSLHRLGQLHVSSYIPESIIECYRSVMLRGCDRV